jgi:hypothetical protein
MRANVSVGMKIVISDDDWKQLKTANLKSVVNGIMVVVQRE